MFGVKVNIYLRNDTFILDLFFLLPLLLFPLFCLSLYPTTERSLEKHIQAYSSAARNSPGIATLRRRRRFTRNKIRVFASHERDGKQGAKIDERYSPCE